MYLEGTKGFGLLVLPHEKNSPEKSTGCSLIYPIGIMSGRITRRIITRRMVKGMPTRA